jgi:hypothetical protein
VYWEYHPRTIEIDSQNNGYSLIVLTTDTTGRMGPGNALFKIGKSGVPEYFEKERWDVRLSGFGFSRDNSLLILRSDFYADHDEDVMSGDLAYNFLTGKLVYDEREIIKLLRIHGGVDMVKRMDNIKYKYLSFNEWRSFYALMKDSYTRCYLQ